jgi:hypothetical protein
MILSRNWFAAPGASAVPWYSEVAYRQGEISGSSTFALLDADHSALGIEVPGRKATTSLTRNPPPQMGCELARIGL